MKVKILIILILSLLIHSCFNVETFSVSGTVYHLDEAVEGAVVSIDDVFNWTTETNESGEYSFQAIPKGRHELSVKLQNDDMSYSMIEKRIQVNSDQQMPDMMLPNTVKLLTVENSSAMGIIITWTRSIADDFREYKIYRKESSGLDEKTGDLIHVSTVKSDTIFTDDDVSPGTSYYYRVYTMNNYGKLGGSNLLSIYRPKSNLIFNGDFEEINASNNFPHFWYAWNNNPLIRLDSTEVYHGDYSMLIMRLDEPKSSYDLIQEISPCKFKNGKRYQLSYWIKHSEMQGDQPRFSVLINNAPSSACDWYYRTPSLKASSAEDWKKKTHYFTYGEESKCSNVILDIDVFGYPAYNVWIDSVSITQVDE